MFISADSGFHWNSAFRACGGSLSHMALAQVEANQPVTWYEKRTRETAPTASNAERNVEHNWVLDPEILECPICMVHLSSPVYQCQNGHPLCSACHVKIVTCPSCSKRLGNIRCLLVEKIIESLQAGCLHASHGCKQILKYNIREEHIKNLCEYRPCPCPVLECRHEGPKQSLPQHLTDAHHVKTISLSLNSTSSSGESCIRFRERSIHRFIMFKDAKEKVQLLFHRETLHSVGEIYFCTSFEDHVMSYDLRVSFDNDMDSYMMMGNALAEDIRQREHWKRKFLLLPFDFSSGGNSIVMMSISLHHDKKQNQKEN